MSGRGNANPDIGTTFASKETAMKSSADDMPGRCAGYRLRTGLGMVLVAASLLTLGVWTSAQSVGGRFTILTLSARPDMISGGNVLVRVTAPPAVPLEQIRVSVNSEDVTSAFRRDESTHTLLGLASGLKSGPNVLAVAVSGRSGRDGARLTVTNHPIGGPIFSGAHEQPYICETDRFKLPSGETLGKPLDANCSISTRVDYYYRSTAGGNLKPLTTSSTPSDLARTTTLDGATVPYVVRIETGTINRAIYEISMLHNPASEQTPDPWVSPAGWNRRLIYTHGGGCVGGWYRQGSTTGQVDDDVMLRQGYAVASASLNVFGNNCNDLLASETMMMVKERFIEAYGQPRFTIGWGCSGGVAVANILPTRIGAAAQTVAQHYNYGCDSTFSAGESPTAPPSVGGVYVYCCCNS